METMTIQYNPANVYVKTLVSLIKQTKAIKIVEAYEAVPNAETLAAMKEAREGNLKTYSNVRDMMSDILK